MHRFTFLSVLLSFGAFAASMTADLPEVVSNRTTGNQQEIGWENDALLKILRKHLVRTDGMELEPRDVICGMYSRLGDIDASFRSNPPSLDALVDDSEPFKSMIDDMEAKCNQDPLHDEKCLSATEGLMFMEAALTGGEIGAFYTQQFRQTKETVEEVLTKPEMCGEGWKHGQKYINLRPRTEAEKNGSPVLRVAV